MDLICLYLTNIPHWKLNSILVFAALLKLVSNNVKISLELVFATETLVSWLVLADYI